VSECVYVSVCVCVIERRSVNMCVCVSVCVRERNSEYKCVCARVIESECKCV